MEDIDHLDAHTGNSDMRGPDVSEYDFLETYLTVLWILALYLDPVGVREFATFSKPPLLHSDSDQGNANPGSSIPESDARVDSKRHRNRNPSFERQTMVRISLDGITSPTELGPCGAMAKCLRWSEAAASELCERQYP